jgi:integrase
MKQSITNALLKTLTPQAKPYEVRDTQLTGFLLRVQPTGTMTYYVEYARGQREKLGAGNVITPIQARDLAKHLLADVAKGYDPAESKRKARQHTVGSFLLEVYQPWATTHVKTSKATLARLQFSFSEFLELKLDELTAWQVEKWRMARKKGGTKDSTINRELNDLKSSLNKAVEWGLLAEHPLATVKRSKVDNNAKVRYLSDEEETRLRQALIDREQRHRHERTNANHWRASRQYPLLKEFNPFEYTDHLAPIVLLAMNTGLRRGELFNLTWDDINLKTGLLTVEGDGAKSGKTRHIPLNDEAIAVIQKWQLTHKVKRGYVFPSDEGGRLDNVRKSWGGMLKQANIEAFRFHDLRHHFASRLVMAGVDLNTVRELLGHSDYKMTLRYAHLAPEHKLAAVQKLNRPVTL